MSKRRRFTVSELVCTAPLARVIGHGLHANHPRRDSRQRHRSGFTILELVVVMTIVGIIIAITGRSIASAYAGNSRSSATRVVGSTLFQARALAVQRSRQSWLVRSGNTIKVLGDSLGTKVQLAPTVDLGARYGVTLGSVSVPAGRDSISFDPRGLLTGTTTSYAITITRGTTVDTVCSSGLGINRSKGC
ncbi:MAG: type II secretion system protein [Gemmatimonadetes bacterium]|jgi:prepilin-type N-terminal cleavage/methylation domain-containing protein|nr:type II secretion system protein [Gemmatimonadota bacterium]